MITIKTIGDFKNTERFLKGASKLNVLPILEKYGNKGVLALSQATPKDTGLTASSWNYRTTIDTWGYNITWFNTNIHNGIVIAILIQYGHGLKNGGYVQPIDYINPAMKSIFDTMAEDLWKEVTSL